MRNFLCIFIFCAAIPAFTQNTVLTGNVGIGTASPQHSLHIIGDVFLQGQITDSTWHTKLYYVGHNLDIGSPEGHYTHNVVNLIPGGASQGSLFSALCLFSASGVGNQEKRVQIHTSGNSFFNGGNVGIGTSTPSNKLEVVGKIQVSSGLIYNSGNGNPWWISGTGNGPAIMLQQHVALGSPSDRRGSLGWMDNNGTKYETLTWWHSNVGIGTTTPDHMLTVNGIIHAKEIIVDTNIADYVFNPDYQLKTLDEVQRFINQNGHLPDVPNEKQVSAKGVSLGEMNRILLQKIEELTLYTLKQQYEISELKRLYENLRNMK